MPNSKATVTPQKVRAKLKGAGFRAAYQYASGKLQGATRLVNAQTWEEGYRVEESGGSVKVYHQRDIYREEISRPMALRYKSALEAAGFKCFVNGRHEVVIVGLDQAAKAGGEQQRPGAPSLFAAIAEEKSPTGIRVVHCQEERYDIYIGRPMPGYQLAGSKWQNPYPLRDYDNPADCLRDYEAHVRARPYLMKSLGELQGKVIGCWCKSRKTPDAPCHGDVLIKLLEEQLRTKGVV